MKTASILKAEQDTTDELRPEYNLDYTKARPNRFAGQVDKSQVVVMLDCEVTNLARRANKVGMKLCPECRQFSKDNKIECSCCGHELSDNDILFVQRWLRKIRDPISPRCRSCHSRSQNARQARPWVQSVAQAKARQIL
jgi:hypothetical protein